MNDFIPIDRLTLDAYTQAHTMGSWMREIYGIGPVLSAGLLAHIDIEQCPTAGHIWHFAGIAGSDQRPWLKGQKRPFNAGLKTLCWKIGQSFMKFSNQPKCYYGHVYQGRKEYEIANNDAGKLIQQAEARADHVAKTTEAWPWYAGCFPAGTMRKYADCDKELPEGLASGQRTALIATQRAKLLSQAKGEPGSGQPMLPPAQIDARARRYAVKLFLSHMHGEWFRRHFKSEPPMPYPIAFMGHVHYVPAPSFSHDTR
jgi:hypothetical protein